MNTFGLKIAAFLLLIATLTYLNAALAPESMEDAGVSAEYAALSLLR